MKHISTALLALCLLLPVFYQAQPLYVKQAYRINVVSSGELVSHFLLPRPDNYMLNFGIVAAGPAISKYDSTVNWLWTRSYAFGGGPGVNWRFSDARNSHDSTFAAIGHTSSSSSSPYSTGFCIKFNSNGDTLWCRKITTPGSISIMPRGISSTLDSGYIVCGSTTTVYTSGADQHAFVAKLTKTGTLSWIKALNYSFYGSDAYTIKQTADSGYIFTGEHGGLYWDAFLAKLDKNGNLSWQMNYWDANSTLSSQISGLDLLVENNGYLLLLNATADRPMLMKTDLNGFPLWAKIYNKPTYYGYSPIHARPVSLRKQSANRWLLASRGESSNEGWIMAVDSLGTILMEATPHFNGVDAAPYKNNNLAVFGNRVYQLHSAPITPGAIGIVVTNSLGTGAGTCFPQYNATSSVQVVNTAMVPSTVIAGGSLSTIQPTLGSVSVSVVAGCMLSQGVGIGEKGQAITTSVYPNPSNGKITIHTEFLRENTLRFELYDVTGRMLMSKEYVPENAKEEIDLDMLEPAVYFYSLHSGGEVIKTGKLLIVK
jgi:hypothetical protein